MRLPDNAHMPPVSSLGIRLETGPDAFGELRDSSKDCEDMETLRRRLAEDGYILLRGILDRTWVDEAHAEALESLVAQGFVSQGPDRLAVGSARVSKSGFESENRRFSSVRRLAMSGRMIEFYTEFMDAEVRAFDHLWMRFMAPGQATGPHCDIIYMGRGTTELYTSWIPLTAVTLEDGPLLVLERSHRVERLRSGYGRMDTTRMATGGGCVSGTVVFSAAAITAATLGACVTEFALRWLTSEFDPGDVLIFTPYTMHASLDNCSRRFRISVDARYQRAADPIDERWIGDQPRGHSR